MSKKWAVSHGHVLFLGRFPLDFNPILSDLSGVQSTQSSESPKRVIQSSRISDQSEPRKPQRCNSNGLTQAYGIRDIAAEYALDCKTTEAKSLEDKALRARTLKDCTTVWMIASDRIRIIRGRPLPGSLRPESKPKKLKHPVLPPPTEVV